jgi:nitric oxide reductase NorD protein
VSWDETLFGWMWRRGRGWLAPRESPEVRARRVALAPLADRLRAVAIAVAGRPVSIREAEAEGGVAYDAILLPRGLDFAASQGENEHAYVVRTALAAAMLRLGLVPRHAALAPLERAIATAIAVVRARAWLESELPGSADALATLSAGVLASRAPSDAPGEAIVRAVLGAPPRDAIARAVVESTAGDADAIVAEARGHALALGRSAPVSPVPLWGWLACAEAGVALDGAPSDPKALPSGTERAMRTRDRITRTHLDPRPLTENPLVHSFEKVHTLEEHKGGKKQLDGSDELEAHADALDELDLREVIRSNEETRSLLRSDAMFDGGAPDLAADGTEGGVPYDEWNEARRAFRDAWCHVHVRVVDERVEASTADAICSEQARLVAPHVDAVRAELARLALARRPRARQLDGPDVDDDAMVDRHASLAARATPPDRLYRSTRRHAPDLAVLLLVDASLSTDGWIEGQRVLDVEREATLVLAEALEGWVDELGVAAFASHTRSDCRFLVVKGMQERWHAVRRRLTSLEPAGYTRIGPAIRHGTTVLERCAARRRLLLVVTDGKPNDYDRYEGRYGIADVAHAVLEADARGVHVHALAIDREARHHLPSMFRAGSYSLLRHPRELAPAMGTVVASMQR